MKTLEITENISELDVLKSANDRYNLFPESDFLFTGYLLAFGDISNLDNQKDRKIECLKYIDYGNLHINVPEKNNELFKKLGESNKVRLWYSSLHSSSYLSFLYIINLLKDKNIQISAVNISNATKDNKHPWSIANFSEDEIKNLLSYEKQLSQEDLSKLRYVWDKLVKENSPLRICSNGRVISVPEDYLDKKILITLEKISSKENLGVNITRLIGQAMGDCSYSNNTGSFNDFFFAHRINRLIEKGDIQIIENNKDKPLRSIIKLPNK